jgi:hypothetical protein
MENIEIFVHVLYRVILTSSFEELTLDAHSRFPSNLLVKFLILYAIVFFCSLKIYPTQKLHIAIGIIRLLYFL